MTKYTRILALSLLLTLHFPLATALDSTPEPSPEGEWLVKDGTAHIRIVACTGKLWGVISKVTEPDTDKNNPDPAKRNRPILGLPTLLAMQPDGDKWIGKVYNAENGKTYDSSISLKSPDILHVQGCVLSVLCGGEDWTRLDYAHPVGAKLQEAPESICKQVTTQ